MLTKKQIQRMKDHNGLPVVFTEHWSNAYETRIRYIVKPLGVHGLIGCAGPLSGKRVLYDADRSEYHLRKSCRSNQRDIMGHRGSGATVACSDSATLYSIQQACSDFEHSYSIQQAFDWLVTGDLPGKVG